MLRGAAHLAFRREFEEAAPEQLGDVVVDVAERGPQLVAEVAGGEGPATVEAQGLQD